MSRPIPPPKHRFGNELIWWNLSMRSGCERSQINPWLTLISQGQTLPRISRIWSCRCWIKTLNPGFQSRKSRYLPVGNEALLVSCDLATVRAVFILLHFLCSVLSGVSLSFIAPSPICQCLLFRPSWAFSIPEPLVPTRLGHIKKLSESSISWATRIILQNSLPRRLLSLSPCWSPEGLSSCENGK